MDCLLCHPLPGYEVWEGTHWRLAVNYNQNTLGKCFLILKCHDDDICDLTSDELTDLWAAIRRTRDALRARFQPDRFNYSFLMNQDHHVHLHVIPRYDTPRAFAGIVFRDRDPIPPFPVPDPIRDQLVSELREAMREPAPTIIPQPAPHDTADQDPFSPPRPLCPLCPLWWYIRLDGSPPLPYNRGGNRRPTRRPDHQGGGHVWGCRARTSRLTSPASYRRRVRPWNGPAASTTSILASGSSASCCMAPPSRAASSRAAAT